MYNVLKRIMDIFASFFGLFVLSPLLIIVALIIFIDDPGPIIFKQKRIGKNNKIFIIYKFRSMKIKTPNLATHLMSNSNNYITRFGRFIRRTSIDEIPQFLNILKGDMSIVGPRPALFNQSDLIDMRTKLDIHKLKPGVTGLAQINGRDELSLETKVKYDKEYSENRSFFYDIKIILLTIKSVILSKGVVDNE